jgi:hypothetical protein
MKQLCALGGILPTLKNNRIHSVDDRIDFSSLVAIDALEELAKQFRAVRWKHHLKL